MKMQLTWDNDRRAVLTCSGDIGFDDRDDLPRKIEEAIGVRSNPQVIFNLEAVDFVNSAGLGALLITRQLILDRKGQLILANVPPKITELFSTTGLDRLMDMAETLSRAREMLDETDRADA